MEKYGIHRSALLPARLAGSFVLTTFLMGLYIIYRGGPEGTWVFFNILFIQSLIFTVLGYISVKSDVAEMEGVKYTAEGYIAPAIFTVVNAVLIWGYQIRFTCKLYVNSFKSFLLNRILNKCN